MVCTGTNANCRGAGLHLSQEVESSQKASLSAGGAISEPEGSLGCTPPSLAFGLSSGRSAGSWFGRAVQSFTWSVILGILADFNELNLSPTLRALVCQCHLC